MSLLPDNDWVWKSIFEIQKDVFGRGFSGDRVSISAYQFWWLCELLVQLRHKECLFGTIASHLNVLYGSEIRVPSYLVSQDIGQSTISGRYTFLPAEDGTDDWIIKIEIQDISEEGEIIED